MSQLCSCGRVIDDTIINQITLNGKYPHFAAKAKCKDCVANKPDDIERKAGYMPSESKMRGQIVITDEQTVAQFHSASARTGGIVAKGVRFSGSRKSGML